MLQGSIFAGRRWWLWCALMIVAFIVGSAADIFQSVWAESTRAAVVAAVILAHLAAGGLALALGAERNRASWTQFLMPHTGGDSAVVAKLVASLAMSSGAAIVVGYECTHSFTSHISTPLLQDVCIAAQTVAWWTAETPRYGVVAAGNAVILLGNCMLVYARAAFDPEAPAIGTGIVSLLQRSPLRETILVCAISTFNAVLCVAAATSDPASLVVWFVHRTFLTAHIICGFVVHVIIGWRSTPTYRLFSPFSGNVSETIASAVSWTLFTVTIHASLISFAESSDGKRRDFESGGIAYKYAVVGALHWTSTIAILANVWRHGSSFAHIQSLRRGRHKAAVEASAHRPHHQEHARDEAPVKSPHSRSMLSLHGCSVLTATSVSHGIFTFVVYMVLMDQFPDSTPSRLVRQSNPEGWQLCADVAAAFLALLPPLTHLIGPLVAGERYVLWQPFRGPRRFIVSQALGWTSYGTGVLAVVLLLTAPTSGGEKPMWGVTAAALLVVAQLLLHASIHFMRDAPSDKTASRTFSAIAMFPAAGPVNENTVISMILVLLSLVLRLVCDRLSQAEMDAPSTWWREKLLVASVVLWLPTPLLAHVSRRHEGVPIAKPFRGCGEYVALQAIGWTFTPMVLIALVLPVVQPPSDTSSEFRFVHTVSGVLAAISPLLLGLSAHLEAAHIAASRKKGARIVATIKSLSGVSSTQKAALLELLAEEGVQLQTAAERLDVWEEATGWRRGGSTNYALAVSQTPITLVVSLLSAACLFCFTVAATISSSVGIVARVVACGGYFVSSLSIGGLHVGFGPWLHQGWDAGVDSPASGTQAFPSLPRRASQRSFASPPPLKTPSRYRLWMPFAGPSVFVWLQASAWTAFAAATFLFALVLLQMVPDASSFNVLLTTGALMAVSPILLFMSIIALANSSATTTAANDNTSFIAVHAEGLLSVAVLVGSLALGYIAQLAMDDGAASSSVAFVISSIAAVIALPFMVVALRKAVVGHLNSAAGTSAETDFNRSFDDGMESEDADIFLDTSPPRSRSRESLRPRLATSGPKLPTFRTAEMPAFALPPEAQAVVMGAAALSPIALLVGVYWVIGKCDVALRDVLYRRYAFDGTTASTLSTAITSQRLMAVTASIGLLLTLVARTREKLLPLWLLNFRYTAVTFSLYLIPTVVVGSAFVPMLLAPRYGTVVFGTVALAYTLAPVPLVRLIVHIANVAAAAGLVIRSVAKFRALSEGPAVHFGGGSSSSGNQWNDVALAAGATVLDYAGTFLPLLYHRRYADAPEASGRLYSPFFSRLIERWIFRDAQKYFQMQIVNTSGTRFLAKPNSPHIIAFHPHGLFPATAQWMARVPDWRKCVGDGTSVFTHAASIIFQVPGLRDFAMAIGSRVVTRAAIESSLAAGNAAVIVPGGQAELIESAFSHEEVRLVTHHIGFLRLAIERQVPVVPVFTFGEHNIQDNVHLHGIQKWFLKRIGFGFPIVPMGAWYLPLPYRQRLTLVIGSPMQPPPTMDELHAFAATYFASLQHLVEKHKAAAGFPDLKITMLAGSHRGHRSDGDQSRNTSTPTSSSPSSSSP